MFNDFIFILGVHVASVTPAADHISPRKLKDAKDSIKINLRVGYLLWIQDSYGS